MTLLILLSISLISWIIIIVFCGIFIAIGYLVYNSAIKESKRYKSSVNWTKSGARLLHKEFVKEDAGDSRVVFKTVVKYSYLWKGENYTNDEIAFGYSGSSNESFHKLIFKKLAHAEEIEIWLNPENPKESVICKVLAVNNNFIKNIGIFFMVISTSILLSFLVSLLPVHLNILDHLQIIK